MSLWCVGGSAADDLPMNLPLGTYAANIMKDTERIMKIDRSDRLSPRLDWEEEEEDGDGDVDHSRPWADWEKEGEWIEN